MTLLTIRGTCLLALRDTTFGVIAHVSATGVRARAKEAMIGSLVVVADSLRGRAGRVRRVATLLVA
jgi:hypothetical protein